MQIVCFCLASSVLCLGFLKPHMHAWSSNYIGTFLPIFFLTMKSHAKRNGSSSFTLFSLVQSSRVHFIPLQRHSVSLFQSCQVVLSCPIQSKIDLTNQSNTIQSTSPPSAPVLTSPVQSCLVQFSPARPAPVTLSSFRTWPGSSGPVILACVVNLLLACAIALPRRD